MKTKSSFIKNYYSFINNVLKITILFTISSCALKESQNPLDPANICGGISATEVGVNLSGVEFRNSTYLNDGVHFDLFSSIKNCLGKDIPKSTITTDTTSGLTISSPVSFDLETLSRNAVSTLSNFGSFIFDPNVNKSSISFNFVTTTDSRLVSSNLDVSSLQPAFVVDTSNYQIVDGAGVSNGDLFVDPGERLTFNLKVSNLSVVSIKSLATSITSSNPNFVITSGSESSFGDLSSKANGTSAIITTIDIDPNTPRGTSNNLTITLTDQFNHTWTKTINIIVSPTVPPPRKTQVLSLASNMGFKGFAADANYWYAMVIEDLGNGVNYWRFYRKTASEKIFSHVCSVLDDNKLKAHLAVDSNYFYIGQVGSVRLLNKTTCASVDTIVPSNGVSTYSNQFPSSYNSDYTFSLSIDTGLMYYSLNTQVLSVYNLTTTAETVQTIGQTMDKIVLSTFYNQYAVFNGIRWAHDRKDNLIWKIDSSNNALAWGALPVSTDSDLDYVKAITTQSGSTLILATQKKPNTINLTSIDVSGWSNTSNQKPSINSNQEIISLDSPLFSGCGVNREVTSSPGCQSITDINTLSLASNMTFKGFAADANYWYAMVAEDLGNGVNYWRFYSKTTADNTFSHVCSVLDDGKLKAHLAVDSNYFYIGQVGSVRLLNKTTCAFVDTLVPSNIVSTYSNQFPSSYNSDYTFSLSIDAGLMYYSLSTLSLSSYNLTSKAETVHPIGQILGKTVLSTIYNQYTVFGGIRWAHDRKDNLIWKIDSSNKAIAWGALPVSTYPDLDHVKAITTQNGTTLILATEKTTRQIKFYTIAVSSFQDQNGQSGTQSMNSQSFIIPTVFAGCSNGKLASSSQQCFGLSSFSSINIPLGSSFVGFAADATHLYLAVNNSNIWTIHKKLPGNSDWSILCSTPVDTFLKAHLAVDSSYFYIGQVGSVRRLNKTNCVPDNTISLAGISTYSNIIHTSYNSNYTFSLSIDAGLMYYSLSSQELSSYNLSSGAIVNVSTGQTLGTITLSPLYNQYTVFGGVKWAHDRKDNLIWKIDSSNKALSWGALPVTTYPDLNYVKAIATQDGKTLILATEKTTGVVILYYFDLINF